MTQQIHLHAKLLVLWLPSRRPLSLAMKQFFLGLLPDRHTSAYAAIPYLPNTLLAQYLTYAMPSLHVNQAACPYLSVA